MDISKCCEEVREFAKRNNVQVIHDYDIYEGIIEVQYRNSKGEYKTSYIRKKVKPSDYDLSKQ